MEIPGVSHHSKEHHLSNGPDQWPHADTQGFTTPLWSHYMDPVPSTLGLTTEDLSPLFNLLKGNSNLASPCTLTDDARTALQKVSSAVSSRKCIGLTRHSHFSLQFWVSPQISMQFFFNGAPPPVANNQMDVFITSAKKDHHHSPRAGGSINY